jgi:hypothetical protein
MILDYESSTDAGTPIPSPRPHNDAAISSLGPHNNAGTATTSPRPDDDAMTPIPSPKPSIFGALVPSGNPGAMTESGNPWADESSSASREAELVSVIQIFD